MQIKRFLCIASACFVVMSCCGIPAGAVGVEGQNAAFALERASGRFSLDVPANKTVGAATSFLLEAGEKVTIRATYSPASADVDFGLISPVGLFHPVSASGGSFEGAIRVDRHGNYTLAIRNNSDIEVTVFYTNADGDIIEYNGANPEIAMLAATEFNPPRTIHVYMYDTKVQTI